MSRLLILMLMAALGGVAEARLYQWRNASSGNVEMSGSPPAWYRTGQAGPRVLVFDRGQLIDDTAIEVVGKVSEDLREAAFREIERRQQEEALRKLERAARREQARVGEREREAAEEREAPSGPAIEVVSAAGDDIPENIDASLIERLKGVVRAWDQQLRQ